MSTMQGEMLSRIARAYQRVTDAELDYQEAKAALAHTREGVAFDNAKEERKSAKKALEFALLETTQLPLPEMATTPTEAMLQAATRMTAARVVTA